MSDLNISVAKSEVVEVKVPAVGESISEVTIGAWSKKSGDLVAFEELVLTFLCHTRAFVAY